MTTLTKVPFSTVACIQLAVLSYCLRIDEKTLNQILALPGKTRTPVEVFALAYLQRVVEHYATRRTPDAGVATNSDEVCNMLMQHWGLKNEELFKSSFTPPELEIDVEKENARASTDIKLMDLVYLTQATELLSRDGVNLNLCVEECLPTQLMSKAPTRLLFREEDENTDIITQFITAKGNLNRQFPKSQWFAFITFAIRLHKGESMPITSQHLHTMKSQPNVHLQFIAEAYEEAWRTLEN